MIEKEMTENKHHVLAYIIIAAIGLFFGTGAIWQIYNLELANATLEFERQKLKFEKQKESVILRSELNETMNKIVKLNKEFEVILYKESISDTIKREYDIRYHLLWDNLERTEECLSAIEGRPERYYRLPIPIIGISPRPPKGVRIMSADRISEPFLTIRLTIFIVFFVSYTFLIILLTIYIPKITGKIVVFIRSKTN